MKWALYLLCVAVFFSLMGCVADELDDTTAVTNAPSTVSTTAAETEATAAPTDETETQAPTQPVTTPTEVVEDEPRQDGLRLGEEELEYFDELFNLHAPPAECYYNLVLNQDFSSIQEINLAAFFEDGSPADMKNEITDSERDYYNQVLGDAWTKHNIDRLSYAMVTDVFQRYLGVTIPQMNMGTRVYNPSTGYYYRAGSSTYRHSSPDFSDGYYDEATGLVWLYFVGDLSGEEQIVTLQYKPEAEDIKFLIVSNVLAK